MTTTQTTATAKTATKTPRKRARKSKSKTTNVSFKQDEKALVKTLKAYTKKWGNRMSGAMFFKAFAVAHDSPVLGAFNTKEGTAIDMSSSIGTINTEQFASLAFHIQTAATMKLHNTCIQAAASAMAEASEAANDTTKH